MAQTKEQKAAAGRKHYAKNRDVVKARARAYTDQNRDKLRQFTRLYKENSQCADCLIRNWIVLEFDHVRGEKKANIGDMVRRSVGIKTLEEEIAKCEVVCSNCHAIRTHNRRTSLR